MAKAGGQTRRVRLGVLAFAVVAMLVPAGVQAETRATRFGVNLVRDDGAEAAVPDGGIVPIPKWTTSSGFTAIAYGTPGYPTAAQASGFVHGSNFFAGGPANARSTARQLIPIVGRDGVIDSGHAVVTFSGRFASYAGQGDSATLKVRFRRADGTRVGAVYKTVPVSATNNDFVYQSAEGVVPVGARSIDVLLVSKRVDGDYNDGYFDAITVSLLPHA